MKFCMSIDLVCLGPTQYNDATQQDDGGKKKQSYHHSPVVFSLQSLWLLFGFLQLEALCIRLSLEPGELEIFSSCLQLWNLLKQNLQSNAWLIIKHCNFYSLTVLFHCKMKSFEVSCFTTFDQDQILGRAMSMLLSWRNLVLSLEHGWLLLPSLIHPIYQVL